MRTGLLAVVAAFLVAGCSGGSTRTVTPQSCIDALDQADSGFTAFAQAVSQTKQAFDVGMSGDPQRASAMLTQISLPSPTQYKTLEAKCRSSR